MSTIQGMLSGKQLQTLIEGEEIDTILVVFPDMYGRFMGKRFDAEFFLKDTLQHGAHACDYLLTVDMEMEPVSGYQFANWESGYGDFHLVPDLSTLRLASWLEKTAMVICDVVTDPEHKPVSHAPRSILNQQIEKAAAMGFSAMAGSELEYYLFQNSYQQAAEQNYHGLTLAGWYIEDYHMLQGAREDSFNGAARRHLKKSGVPVENSKGEWGKGQHELNIQYADVLSMADRHSIYKQCLKEIADQQGISVTFMAKYASDQAGSSCHVHLSLWNNDQNAFPGNQKLGKIDCSNTFRWFLGGWMAHASEVMLFYAPNINSYKRYQSGSWAPTKIAWSYDNRTAGFRVVGKGNSLRTECRIPGADCNPYLTYAAALASGLDGIKNKIEPPPIFEGDVYSAATLPSVPLTLRDAISVFKSSQFAKDTFGEEVVTHYTHFFETELEAYQSAVTDWDRQRYFERI